MALAPCALGLMLCVAPAQASTVNTFPTFCLSSLGGNSAPHTCVETGVGGTSPSDPLGFNGSPVLPDIMNAPGATSATAGASGSLTGTASATANFGLLRASAFATNGFPIGTPTQPNVVSRALASFSDRGPITSVSLVSGALVHAKATLDVDGIFSGAGSARVELIIGGPQSGPLVVSTFQLLDGFEDRFLEFEFNTQVGEELTVAMFINAQANAGASNFTTLAASGADLGNTAHLYLDLDDAAFAALSGHDYRLDAPPVDPVGVAEPTSFASLVLGLVAMAGLRGRRRSIV
jgi:hypothetical protein